MLIEEAISHAEDIAAINENIANNTNDSQWLDIAQCQKCADEHLQLAEWLRELKRFREAWGEILEELAKASDPYGDYELGRKAGLMFADNIISYHLNESISDPEDKDD